jgi:hypothetical protein
MNGILASLQVYSTTVYIDLTRFELLGLWNELSLSLSLASTTQNEQHVRK